MKLRIAYWLVALSVVPLLVGAARPVGLAGVEGAPNDTRFSRSPVPWLSTDRVLRYGGKTTFQFESRLRQAWPRWHPYAGRILAPCGLPTAATGTF